MAIHEGRCVPDDIRDTLVAQETDLWLPRHMSSYDFCLSIVHSALIASAGIDKSNSGGYLTLLPKQPTKSAQDIYQWIQQEYGLKKLAVIITDSHTTPMRCGVSGIAIGAYGMKLLRDYRGKPDLFGRTIKNSQSNMIDPLAAAAVNIMGECDESTPVVIIRDWPGVVYSEEDIWEDFIVDPKDDIYRPLLEPFLKAKNKNKILDDH